MSLDVSFFQCIDITSHFLAVRLACSVPCSCFRRASFRSVFLCLCPSIKNPLRSDPKCHNGNTFFCSILYQHLPRFPQSSTSFTPTLPHPSSHFEQPSLSTGLIEPAIGLTLIFHRVRHLSRLAPISLASHRAHHQDACINQLTPILSRRSSFSAPTLLNP